MNVGNNLLRKYEEITEWRQAMRMLEGDDDDDPMRFLWDTGNFSSSFLTVLMNVIIIGQEICNDTERLRHEYEYDDSLIEVEGIATPTFPELESEPDDIIVTEEIVTETEPALSEEEEMRKLIVKKDQFEKQLDSMVEIMTDLHNGREKQLDTSLVDE